MTTLTILFSLTFLILSVFGWYEIYDIENLKFHETIFIHADDQKNDVNLHYSIRCYSNTSTTSSSSFELFLFHENNNNNNNMKLSFGSDDYDYEGMIEFSNYYNSFEVFGKRKCFGWFIFTDEVFLKFEINVKLLWDEEEEEDLIEIPLFSKNLQYLRVVNNNNNNNNIQVVRSFDDVEENVLEDKEVIIPFNKIGEGKYRLIVTKIEDIKEDIITLMIHLGSKQYDDWIVLDKNDGGDNNNITFGDSRVLFLPLMYFGKGSYVDIPLMSDTCELYWTIDPPPILIIYEILENEGGEMKKIYESGNNQTTNKVLQGAYNELNQSSNYTLRIKNPYGEKQTYILNGGSLLSWMNNYENLTLSIFLDVLSTESSDYQWKIREFQEYNVYCPVHISDVYWNFNASNDFFLQIVNFQRDIIFNDEIKENHHLMDDMGNLFKSKVVYLTLALTKDDVNSRLDFYTNSTIEITLIATPPKKPHKKKNKKDIIITWTKNISIMIVSASVDLTCFITILIFSVNNIINLCNHIRRDYNFRHLRLKKRNKGDDDDELTNENTNLLNNKSNQDEDDFKYLSINDENELLSDNPYNEFVDMSQKYKILETRILNALEEDNRMVIFEILENERNINEVTKIELRREIVRYCEINGNQEMKKYFEDVSEVIKKHRFYRNRFLKLKQMLNNGLKKLKKFDDISDPFLEIKDIKKKIHKKVNKKSSKYKDNSNDIYRTSYSMVYKNFFCNLLNLYTREINIMNRKFKILDFKHKKIYIGDFNQPTRGINNSNDKKESLMNQVLQSHLLKPSGEGRIYVHFRGNLKVKFIGYFFMGKKHGSGIEYNFEEDNRMKKGKWFNNMFIKNESITSSSLVVLKYLSKYRKILNLKKDMNLQKKLVGVFESNKRLRLFYILKSPLLGYDKRMDYLNNLWCFEFPYVLRYSELIRTNKKEIIGFNCSIPNRKYKKLIDGLQNLTAYKILRYLYQISMSLEIFHSENVIFGSLKLRNILLDEKDNIKLFGYGFYGKKKVYSQRTDIERFGNLINALFFQNEFLKNTSDSEFEWLMKLMKDCLEIKLNLTFKEIIKIIKREM